MGEAASSPGESGGAMSLRGHGFSTLPVFLAGICTVLGAIMFLRFGYAVGNVGLVGACAIIVLGHLVTIPTALAIAEIATNRKVEGGGEYFIISRSFGTTIGGAIGIALYLSQAISVAFYMIAFAEAFSPMAGWFQDTTGIPFDPRFISVPGLLALIVPVLVKGAGIGVRALYVVASVLLVSLVLFFMGSPVDGFDPDTVSLTSVVSDHDAFFVVFAIVFPAFTGMTAGVGLSGDLKNPRVSIPRGTLAATAVGLVIYFFIVTKLAHSAPPDMLAEDQLVMRRIAVWGPAILIGLGCATLSSAIGCVLVAPRTLQALGDDRTFPWRAANGWLASGFGDANDPRNTTIVTGVIALAIVFLGNVNAVARLISMFFMVTYGSLCAISFLEHFAARPSYRPSFRSRWWVSLFGAAMCLFLMLQMDPVFALLSLVVMVGLYQIIKRTKKAEGDLAAMFQGVLTQATRFMHIKLQRRREKIELDEWRPSVIMVNGRTFDRSSPLDLVRWLCHRFGFGTYLHYIEGRLDTASFEESRRVQERLIDLARKQHSPVYMDTLVSPSMTSALAQSLQVPGVSGLSNNATMFEFSRHDEPEVAAGVARHCLFAASTGMTMLVLRHGDLHFGQRQTIHIWVTEGDRANANMMILLSYILIGHPDWRGAKIRVFAVFPGEGIGESGREFRRRVSRGRLPISDKNITFIASGDGETLQREVAKRSEDVDLTVMGFSVDELRERGAEVFSHHAGLSDVLFVHAPHEIMIE